MKMPAAFSYFMLDRKAVIGGSYENASGIFMRRAWCEMQHYCFHFVCMRPERESCSFFYKPCLS
jgi:hypothetical protein